MRSYRRAEGNLDHFLVILKREQQVSTFKKNCKGTRKFDRKELKKEEVQKELQTRLKMI